MKNNKIKMTLTAIIFTICAILNNHGVFAAGRAIAVSPMHQRVVLIPGETYRGSMKIANPNNATEDLSYLVEASTYFPTAADGSNDQYGSADYATRTNMNMIVDWIEVDNPTGVLKPNDELGITFSINVPKDAPAGGQYAALLVRENPEFEQKDDNSVGVNEIMQMAHIIYAEVAGETIQKGTITENNMPSILTNGKLEATSMVKNEGNVHTDAEYTLQVWPLFSDEEICTNEEDAETSLILPETERYHAQTCDLPAVGIFKAKQTVKIFGEVSELEKMVIVCPLWLLFIILFIIIALIVWIIVRIRMNKKAKKEEAAI